MWRVAYIQTVDDIMAIKPKFFAGMGYPISLTSSGAPLLEEQLQTLHNDDCFRWSDIRRIH